MGRFLTFAWAVLVFGRFGHFPSTVQADTTDSGSAFHSSTTDNEQKFGHRCLVTFLVFRLSIVCFWQELSPIVDEYLHEEVDVLYRL